MTESNNETINENIALATGKWGKIGYAAFLLLGIYFIVQQDFPSAVSQLSIALIFDPFNGSVPFKARPTWQKAWLALHGVAALVAFALIFFYL